MRAAPGAAERAARNAGGSHSDLQIYGRLLGYVRPQVHFFALSIFGFVIYAASQVGFTELLGAMVDAVSAFRDGENIDQARLLIPLGMVAAVAARGLGSFFGEYFLAIVSNTVVHRLRCELFEQLMVLPSAFYDRSAQGHLVSRVTYTVTQVTGAATKAVEVVVREGLTVIALTGWLLWMNWKLTLVFFAVAPLIAWVVAFASKRFRRISQRIQNAMGDVTHVASEAVSGYKVVRTFGGESYERKRFFDASDYNRRQALKMAATSAISTPVIQILVAAALALLVWLIMDPVFLTGMSQGDVVGFITAAGLLAKPIRSLSEVNAVIQRGLAAATDIFGQFDEEAERDSGSFDGGRARGAIEFRRVGFSYGRSAVGSPDRSPDGSPDRKGAPVLQDISFRVEPGQTVALVGRSGSGKTTLVNLIPRFYDHDSGTVLLDDRPVTEWQLAALRRQVALVSQSVVLFNDTVQRNIAYGGLASASREDVVEAARRAHALEFIERLPEGLDTVIGDDGVMLSGGQRQRLAIARAILKDAPVLILDEATSALDSESEQYIQAALTEVMRGRTTLVIAHRLSTIENAGQILVMEDGRIAERGTHAQLLAARGAYAALHQRQFGGELGGEIDEEGAETDAGKHADQATVDSPDARRADPPADPESSQLVDHSGMEGALAARWYGESTGDSAFGTLLAPLGAVTGWAARRRRARHRSGEQAAWRAPVPVLVVGNITVGGTGKTPLVIWLVGWLQARGWHPGVVARGHGGSAPHYPALVEVGSDPLEVGDEPLLIHQRTGVPVVVDPDRVAATQRLLETGVDIVVADDGLQHYALHRDLEIAVLDGARGLGNGRCLPAGPLREAPARLDEVDLLVSTGALREQDRQRPHHEIRLRPDCLRRLLDGREWPVDAHALPTQVHGVAGIGNPQRFFDTLTQLGFVVTRHQFRDHHAFTRRDLQFADDQPVIMTEKDAIKVRALRAGDHDPLLTRCHALCVSALVPAAFEDALAARLAALTAARRVEPVAAEKGTVKKGAVEKDT